jgi:formylglycine-generating enzyme
VQEFPDANYARLAKVELAGMTMAASTEPSGQVKAGDVKVNLKDGQRYVWIPPGSFRMGCSEGDLVCDEDEKAVHTVAITDGFWMKQTPITVGAWKRYRAATGAAALPTEDSLGRKNLNEASGNESIPVVKLTWEEASSFCQWSGGRLPTEAEWELAARAGSTETSYGVLDQIAWYADNRGQKKLNGDALVKNLNQTRYDQKLFANGNGPKPVGLKLPNEWNLYDMLGNVLQWTSDWHSETAYLTNTKSDPLGPASGRMRVVRGSSWDRITNEVRFSMRKSFTSGSRGHFIGGRCLEK